MRVAAFVSGTGSNLIRILEHQHGLEEKSPPSPYRVELIFSDRKESMAGRIGEEFGVPVLLHDIVDFYRSRGRKDRRDMSLRLAYDAKSVEMLEGREIDVAALAGYMSIVTEPLLHRFAGRMINVHPADLRVRDGEKRRYTGARAVEAAILNGETSLRSTVHVVREKVDYGEILMLSAPVPVRLPEGIGAFDIADPAKKNLLKKTAGEHQGRLKELGDWLIFPKTLELLARGRFAFEEDGCLRFDGRPIPEGLIIDETL